MRIFLSVLLLPFLFPAKGICRDNPAKTGEQTLTFRFMPGKDMFFRKGNEAELERLYSLVDERREEIASGDIPVYVDGYCASLPTKKANLHTAYLRANRVKSELITQKGLKEADFITANYAAAYNGNKDAVVLTLRIPAKVETPLPQPEPEPMAEVVPPVVEERPTAPEPAPVSEPVTEPATTPVKPYVFAVRTNVLYDAMLLPTLGVEWRATPHIGVKLDGSLARWGSAHGRVQKIWLLNPEVRWYLLREKRFYAGVSGNFGQYNLYKYALGSLFSKDTGYQGSFWNAGVTVGYQLCLSHSFSIDFNLGLGYSCLDYDRFNVIGGTRVYKEKDVSKNFWGPTQVGVNLSWTIGGNK